MIHDTSYYNDCVSEKANNILRNLRMIRPENWQDAYDTIRLFYNEVENNIIEAGGNLLFTAYSTAIWEHMNEVERIFYEECRIYGFKHVYALFPAVDYVIDFAMPYFKIGIEIDGKKYHNMIKDEKRDLRLKKYGWTIYRIPARDVHNIEKLHAFFNKINEAHFTVYDEQESEEENNY